MTRVGPGVLAILLSCVTVGSAATPVELAATGKRDRGVVNGTARALAFFDAHHLQPFGGDSAKLPESRWVDSTPAPRAEAPRQVWPNPTVILVKSMVVPGWGQITNRRYLKAAVAIGLESWFIAGAVTEWKRANDARDEFRAEGGDINHFYEYEFHNGNKNDYLWALGVTVFISMFDAYVDAHLRPYRDDRIPDTNPPPGVAVVLLSF